MYFTNLNHLCIIYVSHVPDRNKKCKTSFCLHVYLLTEIYIKGCVVSCSVAKSSTNGLVGTRFTSRYQLQPRVGFKAQRVGVKPLHPLRSH